MANWIMAKSRSIWVTATRIEWKNPRRMAAMGSIRGELKGNVFAMPCHRFSRNGKQKSLGERLSGFVFFIWAVFSEVFVLLTFGRMSSDARLWNDRRKGFYREITDSVSESSEISNWKTMWKMIWLKMMFDVSECDGWASSPLGATTN